MAKSVRLTIYNLLLPAAYIGMRMAACLDRKVAMTLNARKGLRERWLGQSRMLDEGKATVWFHVSSVGEFLQARPVIDMISERHGDSVQLAVTFYSPSGLDYYTRHDRAGRNPAVKLADYLPFDTSSNARFCLDTMRPDLIVYVRYDLWPNLVSTAASRGIPQLLLSGRAPSGTGSLSALRKGLYRELYSSMRTIAAISEEDAEGFRSIVGPGVRVVTTGDIRFDQVIERIGRSTVKLPGAIAVPGRRYVIAGSTWPRDEDVVIPGFAALLEREPGAGLIIAPHEPTGENIDRIIRSLEKYRLEYELLSKLKGEGDAVRGNVIIADGLGYLAELYAAGTIAYIGGGRTSGVHNVLEPALFGMPVLFGPRISNSWEAQHLVDSGSGVIVEGEEDFTSTCARFLAGGGMLEDAGKSASEFVRSHAGAASRCTGLIEELLGCVG